MLFAGVFLIGVYAGYFGAAAGVLMLALLLITTPDTLPRCNALKNVILGLSNVVAAVIFAIVRAGRTGSRRSRSLLVYSLAGESDRSSSGTRRPACFAFSLRSPASGLAIHLGLDAYR